MCKEMKQVYYCDYHPKERQEQNTDSIWGKTEKFWKVEIGSSELRDF